MNSKILIAFLTIFVITINIHNAYSQQTVPMCKSWCDEKTNTYFYGFLNERTKECEYKKIFCEHGCDEKGCLCPDTCVGDVLVSNGYFDIKTLQCQYQQKQECKYGCKNGECIPFPEELPEDEQKAREVIFDVNKKIYDLTKIKLKVHGTEYYGGEYAKVFLQLTSEGQPINNASCFATIYYPNTTKFIDDVGMISLGENGLYYINFFVPEDIYGIYMVSAYCYLPTLAYNLTCVTTSYDGFENGWSGGYGWSDAWYHTGDASIVSSGTPYNGTYHLRLRRGNAWVERPVNNLYDVVNATISFWAKARSFESSDEAYFYFWDGNWHLLKTWVDGEDDNIYHFYTFNISNYHLGNNIIAFESGMSGTGDYFFVDDIQITACYKTYFFVNGTVYQQVRGSGELHISELPEKIYDYFVTVPEPTKISNHDYCIDNQTLGKTITYKMCINDKCKYYVKNETIHCNYGCANNKCLPDLSEQIFIAIVITIIVGIIVFIAWRII